MIPGKGDGVHVFLFLYLSPPSYGIMRWVTYFAALLFSHRDSENVYTCFPRSQYCYIALHLFICLSEISACYKPCLPRMYLHSINTLSGSCCLFSHSNLFTVRSLGMIFLPAMLQCVNLSRTR